MPLMLAAAFGFPIGSIMFSKVWGARVKPYATTVILDLNHVLVHRVNSPNHVDPAATRRIRNHNVYIRPGALEFVDELRYKYKEVGIWSSGMRFNVEPLLEDLKLSSRTLLLAQEECTAIPREGTFPLFMKDLSKIENQHCILVDDSIEKVAMKDWYRAVIVEPWDADHPGTSFETLHQMLMEHPIKKFIRNMFTRFA